MGPPVLWKERRIPLLGKRKIAQTIGAILILGLLALTYGLCAREHMLQDYETHVAYTVVFFGVGLLFTTVLPATCITTERESQTWTLLLTTTVGTWEILGSKLAGAVRRCVPAWFLLLAHLIVFVAAGIIHPVALLQLGIRGGMGGPVPDEHGPVLQHAAAPYDHGGDRQHGPGGGPLGALPSVPGPPAWD